MTAINNTKETAKVMHGILAVICPAIGFIMLGYAISLLFEGGHGSMPGIIGFGSAGWMLAGILLVQK